MEQGQERQPLFLKVEQVAAMFAVSKSSIYRAVDAGELRAVRLGRTVRIPVDALSEFQQACEHPSAAVSGDGGDVA